MASKFLYDLKTKNLYIFYYFHCGMELPFNDQTYYQTLTTAAFYCHNYYWVDQSHLLSAGRLKTSLPYLTRPST